MRRGLSLDQIGELTGRHPSTTSYWMKRHGLSAVHRDRHAAKGGVDRETLAGLVGSGVSTREIATRLGLSQSTVRHWLRKYGLRTHRARAMNSRGVRGVHADRQVMTCPRHGRTEFWPEAVARRRRKLKAMLVEEAGGRCSLCGYDRFVGALQFHLRNGATKAFDLASLGLTRSLEAVRGEAAKCVLLRANCHAEVEGGIVRIA